MRRTSSRISVSPSRAALVAALAAIFAAVTTCGSGESDAGNGIDVAIIAGMVRHHDSAIAMAKIAQKRGQSEYVKSLAQTSSRRSKARSPSS